MSSTSPRIHPNHAAEKIKQLFLITSHSGYTAEWMPFFCVEARVDFNDIRTGFRETVSLSKALEIYSDNADLLWTDDMIRDIDIRKTSAMVPEGARLGPLPAFVDPNFLTRMENQFVQYLLRSFEAKIYRNYDLNLYSFSGESRDGFFRRCMELFDTRKRFELDKLHEVYNRKLEQARQRYLSRIEPRELEQAKSDSRNRDLFSRFSEQFSELFNAAETRLKPVARPPLQNSDIPEVEERLMALEWEARQELANLSEEFDEKARRMDEYILHPNLKDIHFVRSCILWMPEE